MYSVATGKWLEDSYKQTDSPAPRRTLLIGSAITIAILGSLTHNAIEFGIGSVLASQNGELPLTLLWIAGFLTWWRTHRQLRFGGVDDSVGLDRGDVADNRQNVPLQIHRRELLGSLTFTSNEETLPKLAARPGTTLPVAGCEREAAETCP